MSLRRHVSLRFQDKRWDGLCGVVDPWQALVPAGSVRHYGDRGRIPAARCGQSFEIYTPLEVQARKDDQPRDAREQVGT